MKILFNMSRVLVTFLVAVFLVLTACGQRSDTIVSIALHPTKPNIIYVATDEAVYKSSDTGATWTRFAGELARTRVISLAIDPKLSATVFAGTMGDGTYKSPDGGRTWHPYSSGIQKGTISAIVNQIVFNPLGTEMVYAATTVGVFRSLDGGRHWTERMQGMTEVSFVVTLAIDPQRPNVLYAGTTGGVYRTVNATESWEKSSTGMVASDAKMASMALGVNGIVVDPTNSDVVYAGTTDGLYISTDQAEHWTKVGGSIQHAYISAIQLDPSNPSILYMATSDRVQKSEDGGKTWQPKIHGLEATSIRSLQMSPLDPRTLYVGTNGGGLYRSSDAGESWSRLPLTPASGD
ncbi:MAG: glycosyl hydrolase [Nitrospirales bacterium]|nr:MAG: glycosyl hydrolase [Nitrospirales bacterium]